MSIAREKFHECVNIYNEGQLLHCHNKLLQKNARQPILLVVMMLQWR